MHLYIAGTGSALPESRVTNDDLSKRMDTSDEWIYSRTGIHERRIADRKETLSVLSAKAAEAALENAGIAPEETELIVVGTSTPDCVFPSCGCEVQSYIHAPKAFCMDVSAACSGFLYALHTAESIMRTDRLKTALVIGADTLSRHLDWSDRSTSVLFGDGAGAVVLKGSDSEKDGDILGTVLGSDGGRAPFLTCRTQSDDPYVRMQGQEVFRFAVRTVPQCIEEVMTKTGMQKEDIRYYLLHQANARIIDSVARYLKEPAEKFPMNMEKTANTSAASIPVLMDGLNREGKLTRGDVLVLSGFGAGLTWGAGVLRY